MKKRIRIQQLLVVFCFAYIPLGMTMDGSVNHDQSKKSGLLSRLARKTSKDESKLVTTPAQQLSQTQESQRVCKALKTRAHVVLSSSSAEEKKKLTRFQTLESVGAAEHIKSQLRVISEQQQAAQSQPKFRTLEEGLTCLAAQFGCEFSFSNDAALDPKNVERPVVSEYDELDRLLEGVDTLRASRSKEEFTTANAKVFFDSLKQEATVALEEPSLFAIIRSGNLEELQDELARGVLVHIKNSKGDTPLHAVLDEELAISLETRKAFLELLLSKGATLDQGDENGRTPVVAAALSSHPDVHALFPFLYDQQMTAGCIDYEGQTLLHGAVSKGMVEAVEYILTQKKEDLEALDIKKHTPLQAAFENNLEPEVKRKLVPMLIKAGANKEVVDQDGLPLIFRVIKNVDFVGVQLLLAHGASYRSRNVLNQTALEYAEEKLQVTQHPENARKIYELLKEYASGKRVPFGKDPIPPHITIAIPENLCGKIDIDTFRENIRIMITAQDEHGNSILSKALVNSFNKESHE